MAYILILVISAIAQMFLPWWVIAPIAFIVGMFKTSSGKGAWLAGAAAIATLWIAYAAYLNITHEGLMLDRIGNLFADNLKFLNSIPFSVSFFLIMALIGGLVGGFSALAGYQLRQLIK
ncbi:hypothetical protein [Emticicia sp. TH156]|uniref:hypothetical protein n=1 Tax=Emticicia sp. TH156 TaxID=2067454 RepID=UPI000C773323|nr:hypothetical protein [Emticicia sp. TH156]PLK42348.1 hypothetical protein C0V77_21080 [Emticicia sp. TH156]